MLESMRTPSLILSPQLRSDQTVSKYSSRTMSGSLADISRHTSTSHSYTLTS
jgi:hypothetical protein